MTNTFHPFVLKRFIKIRRGHLLLAVAAICGLAACASSGEWLNSDRIKRTFGSYGVDVLYSDPGRRVSSLYSSAAGEKTTRTYAVVDFSDGPKDAYAREQALIEAGNSIGATFRNGGWTVTKRHLYIGALEIPGTYTDIGELMHIQLPETLATHVYVLNISKNLVSYDYATITEIHHPDYLLAADLKKIYGEIIFDDSNRDSIHDFIGPPNPRK
jgi:hypothetical protein